MEEPTTEEAATTTDVGAPAGESQDRTEAETVTEDSPEPAATAPGVTEDGTEPVTTADDDGVDGVGIPRQQSPEETADSEAADDGART
ncbi:hypothetical protein [Streptomyces sp. NPDC048481]|uniref:hypothetical protein n=1 Tax=Streptomyces sp. NPDC048481 TaxID=3365557 RepID=UPI00371189A0